MGTEETNVHVEVDTENDHSKEAYRTKTEPSEPTTTVEVDSGDATVTVDEK